MFIVNIVFRFADRCGCSTSDHLVLAQAVREYRQILSAGGRVNSALRQFCALNFLSFDRMSESIKVQEELLQDLAESGIFIVPCWIASAFLLFVFRRFVWLQHSSIPSSPRCAMTR